ncbi:MAG: hypothetical protein IT558_01810 [Alphaproteobacteria bacterium]|nr:hypothetical protein [Alphaproteobacteria bacterium]
MNEDLQERFDELMDTLHDIAEKIDSGQIVPLHDLEQSVESFCTDVINSGAETAQSFKPLIADMIQRLEEIAQKIEEFRSKLT